MEKSGSITVFSTLLLSIMISLIAALLLSAKTAAGRTQIALSVDLALYSALAKYDKTLFDEYHLLYVDGGFGTNTLLPGNIYDEISTDISYLLTPNKDRKLFGGKNILELDEISGAITGYTLATDDHGRVLKEQIVSYMQDTFALQGISYLSGELLSQMETIEHQEDMLNQNHANGTISDYEKIKEESLELKKIKEAEKAKEAQSHEIELQEEAQSGNSIEEQMPSGQETEKEEVSISPETAEYAKQGQAILDSAATLKKTSLLNLVLSNPQAVSGWTGNAQTLLSNRNQQKGMGVIVLNQEKQPFEDLLFQEYIVQNLNHYGNELRTTGPSYGVEWVVFQEISDLENLEAMANRLMWIREAANVASIYMDESKMEMISLVAEAIEVVLEIPYIKYIIEAAVVGAWAYAESLVDVRALFDGHEVALVKDEESWQVSFADIIGAFTNPAEYYRDVGGISYEGYLRVFLAFLAEEKKISGCMDVIELSMREIEGKEHFSFDCAIDTIETRFEIRSEDTVTFQIVRQRSYRDI